MKRFAHNTDDLHVPAWKWYNEKVDAGGGVGFWAELYVVTDGNYETFYRNM
ncbi:monooxygenase family protein [Halorubrum rubrum]|uniref:Monooxygenase family protein n=1 Tax=Halorubrum rubrum TaxID=1126240 RepID=A0ABD5R2B7_9EURY